MSDGIATAARMPMMATTIMSSMSVKPRSRSEAFLIEIMYSKLLMWSMDSDQELAGGVGDVHPQPAGPVGEREDFDALGLLVIEDERGQPPLLLARERLPARVGD